MYLSNLFDGLYIGGSRGGGQKGLMPPGKYVMAFFLVSSNLKDLCNANACWLVLIYNTLIITNVAKRLFKYVPYILLKFFC